MAIYPFAIQGHYSFFFYMNYTVLIIHYMEKET